MTRKVLFASLVSLLLLTILGCGTGSFGDNRSGKANFGISNTNTNGFGHVAGNSDVSKPSGAPTQPSDVRVSSSSSAMAVDDTMQFAVAMKDGREGVPRWTSSKPSVATIDDKGLATGLTAGTTQITATVGGKNSPPVALTLCDYRHL